jgi:hypothetical protein
MFSLQAQTWPWIALLFLLLFVYLVSTEIQSQDCHERLCYNTTPTPNPEDTPYSMIDKLITTLRVNHSPVEWRKALLLGLITSLIVLAFFAKCLTLSNFILVGLIVFIVVYFAATWTNWTYWRGVDTCLERELLRLRSKIYQSN